MKSKLYLLLTACILTIFIATTPAEAVQTVAMGIANYGGASGAVWRIVNYTDNPVTMTIDKRKYFTDTSDSSGTFKLDGTDYTYTPAMKLPLLIPARSATSGQPGAAVWYQTIGAVTGKGSDAAESKYNTMYFKINSIEFLKLEFRRERGTAGIMHGARLDIADDYMTHKISDSTYVDELDVLDVPDFGGFRCVIIVPDRSTGSFLTIMFLPKNTGWAGYRPSFSTK
ncbi:MAG: hypothetical protein WCP79_00745 [Bacillota bacterium]